MWEGKGVAQWVGKVATLIFGPGSNLQLVKLNNRKVLVGSATCASFAIFLSLVFRNDVFEPYVPIFFLAVVAVVGLSFGAAAGILGCIVAGLIFAIVLFEPVGSLAIRDVSERFNLLWMLLGGVATSCLLARLAPHDLWGITGAGKGTTSRFKLHRHPRKTRIDAQKFAAVLAPISVLCLAILWWVLEHPAPGR